MTLDISQFKTEAGEEQWDAVLIAAAERYAHFDLRYLIRAALAKRMATEIAARLPVLRAQLGEFERERDRLRAELAEAEAEEKGAAPMPWEGKEKAAPAKAALAAARRAYSESPAVNGSLRLAGEVARLVRLASWLEQYAGQVDQVSAALIAFFREYPLS